MGTPDDPRERRLTVHLPVAYAARLFDAQEQNLGEDLLREVLAEGFQEDYFKIGLGGRAVVQDLIVEFTDIRYVDVSFG